MDSLKQKWKKNLVSRTWQRCRRLSHIRKITSTPPNSSNQALTKSKSWNSGDPTHYPAAGQPQTKGCFSVYVGPNRQRFVVKAEFANHPLFRTLLDDAETEYGYTSEGPISLPCDVELFYKVLADMEFYNQFEDDHNYDVVPQLSLDCVGGCIMSPRRRSLPTLGGGGGGSGGYNLLSPFRSLLKLNNAAW